MSQHTTYETPSSDTVMSTNDSSTFNNNNNTDTTVKSELLDESKDQSIEGSSIAHRDQYASAEELSGILTFDIVYNDNTPDNMIDLIECKNIFSLQLPKMPKEYITRLVFDRNHRNLCIKRNGKTIGGICFRPFYTQFFAEIVFWYVV